MTMYTKRNWLLSASVATLAISSAFVFSSANAQEDAADDETAGQEGMVVTGRRVSDAVLAVGVDEASNTISVTREALLSAPSGVSGIACCKVGN